MTEFFIKHPDIALVLIGALASIVAFFFTKTISDNEKRIESLERSSGGRLTSIEDDIDGVKNNYKQEFKDVRKKATDDKEEILKAVYELKLLLNETHSSVKQQANFCALIQNKKNKE